MSALDWVLLALLAAALALAVRSCVRRGRQGKICGVDCARCGRCDGRRRP